VVFGKKGRSISVQNALSHVAGYCAGHGLNDRVLQMLGSQTQFSWGKSYQNFAPIGPWLTSADEVRSPYELAISCAVNGRQYQHSLSGDLAFSVAQLVSCISGVCEIPLGDVMFTGSPPGVGQAHQLPIFLGIGDFVETSIEGWGSLRNVAVAPP
jgi:2,4-diketo-3-deoxy-L-fuconate hydrolase